MNTSFMIKGADFSTDNVGRINIQKLQVAKAGDGMIKVGSGGSMEVITTTASSSWVPGQELAYSEEITMPAGAKYLFGKTSFIFPTTALTTYENNFHPQNTLSMSAVGVIWMFYDDNAGSWTSVSSIYSKLYNKLIINAKKSGLYNSGNYTAAQIQGGIYGAKFADNLNITKMRINWLKPEAKVAPEIGIAIPEIYAGF